ncbi:hypothetical protein TrLO_g9360 [Triparma laevis f. longispina]|uniref:Uncharacterized protein n=1 Tax=Triparma laevis f. longispina TaxID=1714387 RepID=A0A9W7KZY4_9STRA|nr:hypothetical protein TrLO_g9360 [Triparma laevis f. longispina]
MLSPPLLSVSLLLLPLSLSTFLLSLPLPTTPESSPLTPSPPPTTHRKHFLRILSLSLLLRSILLPLKFNQELTTIALTVPSYLFFLGYLVSINFMKEVTGQKQSYVIAYISFLLLFLIFLTTSGPLLIILINTLEIFVYIYLTFSLVTNFSRLKAAGFWGGLGEVEGRVRGFVWGIGVTFFVKVMFCVGVVAEEVMGEGGVSVEDVRAIVILATEFVPVAAVVWGMRGRRT